VATNPEHNSDCIKLDYRFSTNVLPDEEEAAALAEQDLCQGVNQGEPCYYKLSNPSQRSCRREAASMKAFGNLATSVLFENIVKHQLDDGIDENPEA